MALQQTNATPHARSGKTARRGYHGWNKVRNCALCLENFESRLQMAKFIGLMGAFARRMATAGFRTCFHSD